MLRLPVPDPRAVIAPVLRRASRLVAGVVPPTPVVRLAPAHEPALLTALVADALQPLVRHPLARAAVHHLPVVVHVGLRSGRSTATVSVGRRLVRVQDGLRGDVVLVLDGWAEPLVARAVERLTHRLVAPVPT